MRTLRFLFAAVFFGLFLAAQIVSAQDERLEISGGVLNSKAVVLVKPDYPPAARAVDARGAVNVQIVVDEKGDVVSASAVSGHPLLRAAAEKAARRSKFSPTRLSGKLVKVSGVLVYNFAGKRDVQKNEIEAGVLNARATFLPMPAYAEDLKKAGAQGSVTVEIVIDEKGDVTSAKAVSGDSRLWEISEKAARQAKFEPTLLEGARVKVGGVLIYNFALAEGELAGEKVLSAPDVELPPAAKAVNAQGAVHVQVTIDEKGDVISAKAVSGHPLLRAAGEKAALEAKFAPIVLSGEPVKFTRVLTYNFAGGAGKLIGNANPRPKRD